MTTRRSHPYNALNAIKVKNIKKPGRHADGNGLYLIVDPSGAKRWQLRIIVQGRRRDIGLGGTRLVTLTEARCKANEMRAIARDGGDPLEEKRRRLAIVPTFREAAITVHSERSAVWKNRKHLNQWINTVNTYAAPTIGDRRLDQITTPDILKVLSPIWLTKPETARRLKQRLAAIFDWGKAAGYLEGENPVTGVTKGLPKQPDQKKHHRAMAFDAVPDFIRRLRNENNNRIALLAFEFLILTAARTSEVLKARWDEVDFDNATWTIPAERMKAGKEHRVPLSDRCLEILLSARTLQPMSPFVFPGIHEGKPLSNMAFSMVLRRMGLKETVHGFRSTFRDWASERTNFSNEVCEMALAHTIKNKAEAAYRRGDLFEKRRKLMEAWAQYCDGEISEVVQLRSVG
ncbi:MAG: integrase arm-type DNA-binding domain-containing protein [Marinicaulis sp.]|nr:integrase arm-type DNA-binding domain-containing protein [Marinicaulis sp.]